MESLSPNRSAQQSAASRLDCFGVCTRCERKHQLPVGQAEVHAREVMVEFESIQRLDYRVPDPAEADPALSFAALFPEGVGCMFGVLEALDDAGETVFLRAFSSLREGIRCVEGWVPPVLSQSVYDEMILPAQAEIKSLTAELESLTAESPAYRSAEEARRSRSRALWEEMCRTYRFMNFRGEERALREAVLPGAPITGGMGECCAPKLLNHAARKGLRPVSLAEFYWGDGEGRGGRVSGRFYPSCAARCQPLLGFLLCGAEAAA